MLRTQHWTSCNDLMIDERHVDILNTQDSNRAMNILIYLINDKLNIMCPIRKIRRKKHKYDKMYLSNLKMK